VAQVPGVLQVSGVLQGSEMRELPGVEARRAAAEMTPQTAGETRRRAAIP
jgi:hypothetical protein